MSCCCNESSVPLQPSVEVMPVSVPSSPMLSVAPSALPAAAAQVPPAMVPPLLQLGPVGWITLGILTVWTFSRRSK